jgi:hypothetical protein
LTALPSSANALYVGCCTLFRVNPGHMVKSLLGLQDVADSPVTCFPTVKAVDRRIARAERWMTWEHATS